MIAEILLVLGGHRSSLFDNEAHIHPAFTVLHPGEKQCLESLASIGLRYRQIKTGCSALLSSSKSPYICTACATMTHILRDYESTVVDTEARVLRRDIELVATGVFVPLSSIRAIFSEWDAPLTALQELMADLEKHDSSPTAEDDPHALPGPLIDMLIIRTSTGVRNISEILSRISLSVQRVWKSQLISYLHCRDSSPARGTTATPSTSTPGSDHHSLPPGFLPSCISETSKDSIAYIGRAVGSVISVNSRHNLPRNMMLDHVSMLENVMPQDQHAFDHVISEIRAQVSNHLWLTVLTQKDVEEVIDTLARYFLLKNGEFFLAFLREVEQLKLSRLKAATHSSGMIREQDLSRALLRASLGTEAQHDPALTNLRILLPSGPLRPLLPSLSRSQLRSSQSNGGGIDPFAFISELLGTPMLLSYRVTFPLNLFLDKPALDTYAALYGYLSGIRRTHTRIHDCWESLSNAQRQRRVWTGLSEGGTHEDLEARKQLLRCGWGIVRDMSWFLDTLLGYTMIDVVASEYNRFKALLQRGGGSSSGVAPSSSEGPNPPQPPLSGSAPPPQNNYLDFTTLRNLHTDYLERLLSGCLITNSSLTTVLLGIFAVCERFVAQVERWGGDVLPALLSEGTEKVGAMVQERWKVVEEINDSLHSHFDEFYEALSSTISKQPFGSGDASKSILFNSYGDNLAMPNLNQSKGGVKSWDNKFGVETRRHVERLLLRLDFNTAHQLRRDLNHQT